MQPIIFKQCDQLFLNSVTVNGRRHGHGGKHPENPVEAHLYPKASGYQCHVMPTTQGGNIEFGQL